MKKMYWKSCLRDFGKSKGRFFAIIAIVALGAGFFGGIKATSVDMKLTADQYYKDTDLYDIRVVSTLGVTDKDVEALQKTENVDSVIPSYRVDALIQRAADAASSEMSSGDQVVRIHSMPEQEVNTLVVKDGRLPEAADEIAVVSGKSFSEGFQVGEKLRIDLIQDPDMEDTLQSSEFTVVGLVDSPLYMSFDNGSSSKGSGTVSTFAFLPEEAFLQDAYSELYIQMRGSESLFSFSDSYKDAVGTLKTALEDIGPERCDIRKNDVITEATDKLDNAKKEYNEKKAEADEKLADAQSQLDEARQELADGKSDLTDAKQKLADGKQELADKQKEYDNTVADTEKQLKEVDDKLFDAEWEIAQNEITLNEKEPELDKAKEQLESAKRQLDSGESQYSQGRATFDAKMKEYENGLAQYNAGMKAWETKNQEWQSGQKVYEAGEAQYTQQTAQAEAAIAALEKQRDDALAAIPKDDPQYESTAAYYAAAIKSAKQQSGAALSAARAELDAAKVQLNSGKQQLEQGKAVLDTTKSTLDAAKPQLDAAAGQLSAASSALSNGWSQYNQGKRDYEAGLQEYQDGWQKLNDAKQDLADGKAELADKRLEFEDAKADAEKQIADARQKLNDAQTEISDGEKKLADGEAELADAQATYNTEKADAEKKLADAKVQIEDAEQQIADISAPDWYVLDRNESSGYAGFEQDTARIDAIATVFPVFFFLVAALVCLTTMTRMVEEERTQVGVMKALGYGHAQIIGKYVCYASVTSMIGSTVGLLVGFQVFPKVIWAAYGIMYTTPPIETPFNWEFAIIAAAVFLLCTIGATLLACWGELISVPAELIRPKPPKNGKRIFLENIPFLWKHMSFTAKLTARNIFRYKKRFLMTVIGIAGCTALMLTGFGLKDSINGIVTNQFVQLSHYDMQVTFAHEIFLDSMNTRQTQALNLFEQDDRVGDTLLVHQQTATAWSADDAKQMEAYLFVPQDTQAVTDFFTYRVRRGHTPIPFPAEGAIITEKMANELGLSVGGEITLEDADHKRMNITIAGICENYIQNYVYLSPAQYETLYGKPCGYQGLLAKLNGSGSGFETTLSEDLLSEDEVMGVSFISAIMDNFSDIFDRLDLVVLVLIISASLLAFVVLYNLTNINVNERIREIATIKVLGFYNREVDSYIYRENMILTALGIGAGFIFGVFLHQYVMQVAEVNIVMFGREILPLSYLWAGLLTLAFAGVVNFVMHFRLKRVSMVESLKSIE